MIQVHELFHCFCKNRVKIIYIYIYIFFILLSNLTFGIESSLSFRIVSLLSRDSNPGRPEYEIGVAATAPILYSRLQISAHLTCN
jgi:hypothetical protein